MFSDQGRGEQQYPMPGTPATNAATSYSMVSFGGSQNHIPGNQGMEQQHYPVPGTLATTASLHLDWDRFQELEAARSKTRQWVDNSSQRHERLWQMLDSKPRL